MADAVVRVVDNRAVVVPFGSELLTPLVAAVAGVAEAAQVSADTAEAAAQEISASLPVIYMGDLSRVISKIGTTPFTISQTASGALSVTYPETDEASADPARVEYWVDPVSGSDANDGLSSGSPKKSVGPILALSSGASKVVNLAPGVYYRDTSVGGVTYSHLMHLTLKPTSGRALLTTALAPAEVSWAASGSAWGTAATGVTNVFDASAPDYRGMPRRYANVANLAAVQALAGSWCEVGGVVYVRAFDDRTPDDEILVNMNTGGFAATVRAGKTFYAEDVGFMLGSASSQSVYIVTASSQTGFFTAIRCFFGAGGSNALEVRNTTAVWLRDCTGGMTKADALNYHRVGHNLPMAVVEHGCHAYDCGIVGGSGTNNCSTAHEGIPIIRINCVYFNSNGPVVADVNGCTSLIVNCSAARSILVSGATAANFYADNTPWALDASPEGEMWLVSCSGGESLNDIGSDGSAAISYRNWRGPLAAPTLLAPGTATRL